MLNINQGMVGILLFLNAFILGLHFIKQNRDKKHFYNEMINTLTLAMEIKDTYTHSHSMRVSSYAYELGKELGLTTASLKNLKMAALLHDIGKIGIDEKILNKPESLTFDEYNKIKKHPEMGVSIIKNIHFLREASNIILSHHEHCDGTGYPFGREKQEISTESSILCIADIFDALTSDRPYRKAMTREQALDIIDQGKGKLYHEKVADVFIQIIQDRDGQEVLAS